MVYSAFSGPMFTRDPDVYFPLMILLGLVVALTLDNREQRSPWRVPFLVGYLLLLGISAVAYKTAEDGHRHVVGWTRMAIAGLPLVALGIGTLVRARAAVVAYALMVLVGGICTAIAIGEAGYHFSLPHALETRLRLFGQDPNIVAPYFAVAPPILLYLLVAARGFMTRTAAAVALAAALIAVYLTGSRTSQAATLAGLYAFVMLWVVVGLWRARPGLRKLIAIGAVVTVLVGVGGAFALKDRVVHKFQTDSSLKFRAYLWETAVDAIEERPLLGYGFLSREPLMVHAEISDLDGRPKDTHPHQIVLNMAMGAGAPAALLFVGLVAWFFLRMILVATRLAERRDWLLALAAFGSAVALLIANTLDQGLSLNTPFALHLGLLLGVGAALVSASRGVTDPASAAAQASGRIVLCVVGVLVALLNVQVLASNRLWHRVTYHANKGDLDRAAELAGLHTRVNPHSLDAWMQRADMLARKRETQAAKDVLWRASREHEMSARPWDQLSLIESGEGGWRAALNSAEEALERDPTGPHASEWALRAATYLVRMFKHEEAEERMAEAFLFDFNAPNKLSMIKIGDRWAYNVAMPNTKPIYLEIVLKRNKALIPELCRTDWIKARRVATTIVKICLNFYLYDLGEATVETFKEHTPQPWLSLDILAEELKEAKRVRELGNAGQVDPNANKRSFQESAFEGTAGEAAIFLSRGNNFLRNGEPERALMAFEEGLTKVEDMYSERGFVKDLVDGVYQAHLKKGDLPSAERALRPSLYFHRLAVDRVERILMLVQAYKVQGQHKAVIRTLNLATPYIATLQPARAGTVIADAAILLGDYASPNAPENLQDMAWSVVDDLGSSPQGRLFRAYLHREAGDKPKCREMLLELAKDHPEWNLDRAKAPDWTPPPPEYTAPKDGLGDNN